MDKNDEKKVSRLHVRDSGLKWGKAEATHIIADNGDRFHITVFQNDADNWEWIVVHEDMIRYEDNVYHSKEDSEDTWGYDGSDSYPDARTAKYAALYFLNRFDHFNFDLDGEP